MTDTFPLCALCCAGMRSLNLQNWSERTEGSEFRGKRRVQEFKPLSVKAL